METLETPRMEPHDDEHALVHHRKGSLVAKGMLAAAALFGLVVLVRELPDLRRYLRMERM